ncbi:T9SS type A sorting domain-containing protein [Sabulilitoribacter multivorans]|uniref:T9SS type A sorting domain-containing protein n=1 Tax=Flaviramulus multivorans TaxID=1304750 RepID=A0ABS9ILU0_9FLAO|nr:T9SS type A sorting domain-containing protein [Flaviramulus multivorans]MCF7561545.1 T9SS type A sorting domain-containing protein [Flaviramulus multivorans]
MKNKIIPIFITLFTISVCSFSQTACDGTLPFEEQNGLLTIEMESGILPSGSNWQTGSESDPNLSGSTINYIFWNGIESFNALSGAPITYNIKINNPGTYRFTWRGRIGAGSSGGEHNDAWLRIVADDFYATKVSSSTSTQALEPKPNCNSNPNRDCPVGSSVDGYFKAFMNRHPINSTPEQRWGFVTNTNDGDSFRFIWATFNTAGNYSVIVDARSNFFFMDKMVLRRSDVSDGVAFNLNNPESSCYEALSINDVNRREIKIYPNPTNGIINIDNLLIKSELIISNMQGAIIKTLQSTSIEQSVDISNLQSGIYFLTIKNDTNRLTKKITKI